MYSSSTFVDNARNYVDQLSRVTGHAGDYALALPRVGGRKVPVLAIWVTTLFVASSVLYLVSLSMEGLLPRVALSVFAGIGIATLVALIAAGFDTSFIEVDDADLCNLWSDVKAAHSDLAKATSDISVRNRGRVDALFWQARSLVERITNDRADIAARTSLSETRYTDINLSCERHRAAARDMDELRDVVTLLVSLARLEVCAGLTGHRDERAEKAVQAALDKHFDVS